MISFFEEIDSTDNNKLWFQAKDGIAGVLYISSALCFARMAVGRHRICSFLVGQHRCRIAFPSLAMLAWDNQLVGLDH